MSRFVYFKTLFLSTVLTLMAVGQGFGALADTTISGKTYKKITSCQDLVDFSAYVNQENFKNVSTNAIVTAPIDMSTCAASGFTPIGCGLTYSACNDGKQWYKGTFDGQGYPITNMKIVSDGQNVGMFAAISGNTVQNVVLLDVDIVASKAIGVDDAQDVSVGGIFGYGSNATVKNSTISGTIASTGTQYAMGGIGGNLDKGTVSNCLSTVNINVGGSQTNVGGILGKAGQNTGAVTIQSCVYDGSSLDNSGGAIGGILGWKHESNTVTLKDCFFNSTSANEAIGNNACKIDGTGCNNGKKANQSDDVGGSSDLNTPEFTCKLNGGTWNASSSTCSNANSNVWSNGDNITNTGVGKDDDGNIVFTISFNANGGNFPANAKTTLQLKVGDAISDANITKPTRSNYTFVGWATTSSATTALTSLGTVQKATEFFAVWKSNVTITFSVNNTNAKFADNSTSKTKSFAYNEVITAEGVENPLDFVVETESGSKTYVFMGWATTNDATAPSTDLGNADAAKTIYAVWNETTDKYYTVTFYSNGHGTAPAMLRLKEGSTITNPGDLTADGYTFDYWCTTENCDYDGTQFTFDGSISADVDLYAKWSVNNYTITYNLNGDGTYPATNSANNPASYTVEYNDFTLEAPTREGHVFDGWKDAGGNIRSVIVKGSTGDLTLTAQWTKKTFNITYSAGQFGKEIVEPQIKEYGTNITLKGVVFTSDNTTEVIEQVEGQNVTVQKKWVQKGWAVTDGGKKAYDLGATFTKNESITLYPYWELENESEVPRYQVTYNVVYKLPSPTDPAVTIDSVHNYFIETEVYDIQGRKHSLIKGPTVEGYTFSGWTSANKTDGDHAAVAITNGKIALNSNTTVSGTMTPINYTITYVDGGTHSNPLTYTIRDQITFTAPTKDGFEFVGWYSDENFVNTITSISKGSTGDIAIYAKWKELRTIAVKNEAGNESFDLTFYKDEINLDQILTKIDSALTANNKTAWKIKAQDSLYNYTFAKFVESSTNVFQPTFTGAAYNKTITVKYGEGNSSSKTVTILSTDTEEEIKEKIDDAFKGIEITKTGTTPFTYEHDGWKKTSNGTDTYYEPTFQKYVDVEIGDVDSDGTQESIHVAIADDANDEAIIEALKDYINKTDPKVTPVPSDSSTDSTYAYTGFAKDSEGDGFHATFTSTAKTEIIIVKYGENDNDTIQVEITLPDNRENGKRDSVIAEAMKNHNPEIPAPTKDDDSPFKFRQEGWKEEGGEYVPNWQKYVEIEVTYKEGENQKTETIAVDIGESTDISGVPGVIVDTLDHKHIVPLKDGWSYNDAVAEVKDADGKVTGYEPVFKKNITVIYTDENGVEQKPEVEILSTDTEEDIENKIDAALGTSEPTKEDDPPFKFRHDGWTQGEDGNYVPTFQKYVEIKVTYKEGENQKTETITVDISETTDISGVPGVIADTLKSQNIVPLKTPTTQWTYNDTIAEVKDSDGNVTGYEPVFKKNITVVYTDKDGDEQKTVEILSTDTEKDIEDKIDAALGESEPTKPDEPPFSYEHDGWTTDGDGNYVPTFQKYVNVEIGDVDGDETLDSIHVAIANDASSDDIIDSIQNYLDSQTPPIVPVPAEPSADSIYTYTHIEKKGDDYVPEFTSRVKMDTITVAVGKDTVKVPVDVVTERDTAALDSVIADSLANHTPAIVVPVPPSWGSEDSVYTHVGFEKDSDSNYVPKYDVEVKKDTIKVAVGDIDNDGKQDSVGVEVHVTDCDSIIIEKIENYLSSQTPPIVPVPADSSTDSLYTYAGFEKDSDSNYVPTFTSEVKKDTITVAVGKDTVTLEVNVTDSEAEIGRKIDEAIKVAGLDVSKADEPPFAYEHSGWEKNGDGNYVPTYDTFVSVDVTYVDGKDTLSKIVKVPVENEDDSQVVADIEKFLDNQKPPVVPVPSLPSADSLYTYEGFKKEGDQFVPDFSAIVKMDTITVVVGKDTIEIPVDVVTEKDQDRLDSIIADSLANHTPAIEVPVPPAWASDDSTYTHDGFEKDDDGNYVPKYDVQVKKDTIHVALDDIDGDGVKDTIDVVVHRTDSDSIISEKIDDALENHDPKIPTPTKADTEDSTYTHSGWERNGDGNYVPTFTAEEKEKVIDVVVGRDTIQVVIDPKDTLSIAEQIEKEIAKHEDIEVPVGEKTDSTEYKVEDWKYDDSTGKYVPVIEEVPRTFKIVYVMPEATVLSDKVNSYTFGKKTVLPTASIKDDDEWVFMGWFTEDEGMGYRVSYVSSIARGTKTYYAYFQKSIKYETRDGSGTIQIMYTNEGKFDLEEALNCLVSKNYVENGITYGFDRWEVDKKGVYHAKYKVTESIHSTVVAGFNVMVNGRQLSLKGVRKGSTVTIFDMKGKIVTQGEVFHGGLVFQLPHAGNYIVRVGSQARTISVR